MSKKPLHALVVHWPLAFFSTAYMVNVVQPLLPYFPTLLQRRLPSSVELENISHYALSAGLLTAIPALISGVLQAGEVNKPGSTYEADGKTLRPKVKTLFLHAGVNNAFLLASLAFWWIGPQSEVWKVGLSMLLGSMVLYTANLGAKLVFNFGAGVGIASTNKTLKQRQA